MDEKKYKEKKIAVPNHRVFVKEPISEFIL